jgi:hypothetical protein
VVNIAVSVVNVEGDLGGLGISRYHWQTPGGTTPVSADCNSAIAALHTFYDSIKAYFPGDITWSFQQAHLVVDAVSAVPIANVSATVPQGNVTGTDSSQHAAGVGARLNWKSSSVFGRRFMRGCNFIVPLGGGAYDNTGGVSSACYTAIATGALAMIAAFQAAGLELVIYGRPKKGLTTGGHVGTITSALVPSQPAGLRSRRE